MIKKEHVDKLFVESGITEETIKEAGLSSCDLGISFPYYNLAGEFIGYRHKLDNPEEGKKYIQAKGSAFNAFFMKSGIDKLKGNSPLLICEGEKKLLALQQEKSLYSYGFVSYPGCWNFKNASSEGLAGIWDDIPLINREVFLLVDTDFFLNKKVFSAGIEFIKNLTGKQAQVKLIDLRLPGSLKMGPDDFLLESSTEELHKRLSKPRWEFGQVDKSSLHKDLSDDEVTAILKKSILLTKLKISSLLSDLKRLTPFSTGDLKVELKEIKSNWSKLTPRNASKVSKNYLWDKDLSPISELFKHTAKALDEEGKVFIDRDLNSLLKIQNEGYMRVTDGKDLSNLLAGLFDFKKGRYDPDKGFQSDDGFQLYPVNLGDAFLSKIEDYSNLKPLKHYVTAPIFHEDRLIYERGYHPKEKIYYDGPPITPRDSLEKTRRLIDSFPFQSDIDKVNFLGAIVGSVFLRCQPHASLIFKADDTDLGKTTAAKCIAYLMSKRIVTSFSFNSNDEEFEKTVATKVKTEDLLLIDNAKPKGVVSSPVIERCVTDTVLSFRKLGGNSQIRRRNDVVFALTCNDSSFAKDILTRSITVFLSADRREAIDENFDPLEYISKNRTAILEELTGLFVRWIDSGSPLGSKVKFPKFPRYAKIIEGCLDLEGYNSFLGNHSETMSKLDPIMSGLLQIGADEALRSEKKNTEFKSPKEWLLGLESSLGPNAFDNISPHAKIIKLGKKLGTMAGKKYPVLVESELVKIKTEVKTNLTRGPRGRDYRFSVLDSSTFSTSQKECTTRKTTPKPVETIDEKKSLVQLVHKKVTSEVLVKKTKNNSLSSSDPGFMYEMYEDSSNPIKPKEKGLVHPNNREYEDVLDKKEITFTTTVDESWSRPLPKGSLDAEV